VLIKHLPASHRVNDGDEYRISLGSFFAVISRDKASDPTVISLH
jgi:hypothetical protein